MRRGRPSDDSPVSGLAECVDSDITDWGGLEICPHWGTLWRGPGELLVLIGILG